MDVVQLTSLKPELLGHIARHQILLRGIGGPAHLLLVLLSYHLLPQFTQVSDFSDGRESDNKDRDVQFDPTLLYYCFNCV